MPSRDGAIHPREPVNSACLTIQSVFTRHSPELGIVPTGLNRSAVRVPNADLHRKLDLSPSIESYQKFLNSEALVSEYEVAEIRTLLHFSERSFQ
jgi:hypothetical protein